MADLRVPISSLFPRASQGHGVQDRAVVADDRGFAHDDARRVVHQQTSPNLRGRMHVHRPQFTNSILNSESGMPVGPIPALPEDRRHPLRLRRMEALEEHDALEVGDGRRVPG